MHSLLLKGKCFTLQFLNGWSITLDFHQCVGVSCDTSLQSELQQANLSENSVNMTVSAGAIYPSNLIVKGGASITSQHYLEAASSQ